MTTTRDFLSAVPVFATLSERAVRQVASLMTPVRFADGDVLCREDSVGREALLIAEGEVAVSRGDDVLAELGPGQIVGELSLLDHQRRTATVTAVGPVTAYVMSIREFHSILALPGVGDEVRRIADQRRPVPAVA